MKKLLISVLLILAMSMGIFASAEEADALIGEWYLTSIDDASVSDTGTGIIIGADGEAVLSYNGNVKEVEWRIENGNIIFSENGEDLMYVNIGSDETLWVESEGSKLVFSQEQNSTANETVAVSTAVEPADFIGIWVPKSIIAYGSEYAAEEFGFTTGIRISDGEAVVNTDDGEISFETEFASNTLYIGDDESTLECKLREDGCMIFDLEEDGIVMTIVMEKSI